MMLCDMTSGSTSHILRSHTAPVLALAWSPLRDHCLATGGQDNTIVLWDVRRASGPLMSLDQHNGSGSSNTSAGGDWNKLYVHAYYSATKKKFLTIKYQYEAILSFVISHVTATLIPTDLVIL